MRKTNSTSKRLHLNADKMFHVSELICTHCCFDPLYSAAACSVVHLHAGGSDCKQILTAAFNKFFSSECGLFQFVQTPG